LIYSIEPELAPKPVTPPPHLIRTQKQRGFFFGEGRNPWQDNFQSCSLTNNHNFFFFTLRALCPPFLLFAPFFPFPPLLFPFSFESSKGGAFWRECRPRFKLLVSKPPFLPPQLLQRSRHPRLSTGFVGSVPVKSANRNLFQTGCDPLSRSLFRLLFLFLPF